MVSGRETTQCDRIAPHRTAYQVHTHHTSIVFEGNIHNLNLAIHVGSICAPFKEWRAPHDSVRAVVGVQVVVVDGRQLPLQRTPLVVREPLWW